MSQQRIASNEVPKDQNEAGGDQSSDDWEDCDVEDGANLKIEKGNESESFQIIDPSKSSSY